jgi:RNA polymerase sigma-70 factor (ECF subfamily)
MPPPPERSAAATLHHAKWFADEVRPHEPHLRAYLRRSFPGVRDVDDVVQESYLRLWRKHAAAPLASTRAFLFRVARNFAIDVLRRHRPIAPAGAATLAALPDDTADPHAALAAAEFEALLISALESLPARQRQIVVRCKLQRLPAREVAAELGLAEKTVHEHLYRGLQRLGEELKRRGTSAERRP